MGARCSFLDYENVTISQAGADVKSGPDSHAPTLRISISVGSIGSGTIPIGLRIVISAGSDENLHRQGHEVQFRVHPKKAPLPCGRGSVTRYTSPRNFGRYPGNTPCNDGFPLWRLTSSPKTSRKSLVRNRSRPSYSWCDCRPGHCPSRQEPIKEEAKGSMYSPRIT